MLHDSVVYIAGNLDPLPCNTNLISSMDSGKLNGIIQVCSLVTPVAPKVRCHASSSNPRKSNASLSNKKRVWLVSSNVDKR